MAIGLDALLDFLLSEIALCGVQGAGSADFYRFIQKFYEQDQNDKLPEYNGQRRTGRAFHERVWTWVSQHPDIRIVYRNESRHYSLSEFEAVERQETGSSQEIAPNPVSQSGSVHIQESAQPAPALTALGKALQKRLTEEQPDRRKYIPKITAGSVTAPSQRKSRKHIQHTHLGPSVFDEPDSTVIAPRLYASQNRTWQALTGHGIDLKKVPSMEFVLLSLIAARGGEGITQPDLTQSSGQDKRSVPHRTDELARKGYIVKEPVQAGKIRTSLCVHSKFVDQRHFLTSGAVEDVYKKDAFVLSGFVHLLYGKLKDAGIVPTRDVRKKLGVPMTTWNKRATQGALIRLDQTGMIKRFRVRKKQTEDMWITCIRILREPRDEDVSNLGFRRQATANEDTVDELLDDDGEEDTLMRDLEVEMLDSTEGTGNPSVNSQHNHHDFESATPQWTPDRLLANIVFDVVNLGGADGLDASMLRDRIVGPFWRRPLESYMTRITDDWEKTQPQPLRHLTIIRDSRNTEEKKFLHYVYRTYQDFQKAVEAGIAQWAGVSQPASLQVGEGTSAQYVRNCAILDPWGFQAIRPKDLLRNDGSATLSEARLAMVHRRVYGPRYDKEIRQEIGLTKSHKAAPKSKTARVRSEATSESPQIPSRLPRNKPGLSITLEQRRSLGLKEIGRLSKNVMEQIAAHRRISGNPNSLPDKISDDPARDSIRPKPLMSAEERIAQGLPPRGRLGKVAENKIREERGLAKLPDIAKKKDKRNAAKEPTLLSKEKRIALGWTAHGRLPQDLIEGLRREREEGIDLEDSQVIASYMDIMRAKANKALAPELMNSTRRDATLLNEQLSPVTREDHGHDHHETFVGDNNSEHNSTDPTLNKRKADNISPSSPTSKRQRVEQRIPASGSQDNTDGAAQTFADTENQIISLPIDDSSGDVNGSAAMSDKAIKDVNTADLAASAELNQVVPQYTEAVGKAIERTQRPKIPPPPLTSSLVLQPELSSLGSQAQAILDLYTGRRSQGLYINPFAKHKTSRGRPRKAYIATFKLERLKEFAWFIDGANESHNVARQASVESETTSTQKRHVGSSGISSSENSPPLCLPSSPRRSGGPNEDKVTKVQHDSLSNKPGQEDDTQTLVISAAAGALKKPNASGIVQSVENECHTRSVFQLEHRKTTAHEHSTIQSNDSTHETSTVVSVPEQQEATSILDSVCASDQAQTEQPAVQEQSGPAAKLPCETTQQHHPGISLTISRNLASLRTMNGSSSPVALPYASPYGLNVQPQSISTGQAMDQSTNLGNQTSSVAASPAADIDEITTSLPEGLTTAIAEERLPQSKTKSERSKKPPAVGSGLLVRRNLIKDIIDLCGGVFPDQGEIGRPFSTLWDQRHGKVKGLKKPLASTVNDTIRNMCITPAFGLKRMFFRIKTRHGPVTLRRSMITYAHMTPKSPEVLRLAHNIANFSLPKSNQYFPEEIRHLVDDTSLYMPVKVAPKDESIVLNNLPPEMEKKLKNARIQAHRLARKQKAAEAKAAMMQNARVEQAPADREARTDGVPREKRARLASLNDKKKRYRRAPAQKVTADDDNDQANLNLDAVGTSLARPISLVWTRPWVRSDENHDAMGLDVQSSSEENSTEGRSPSPVVLDPMKNSLPADYSIKAKGKPTPTRAAATATEKGSKRVTIADLPNSRATKKARINVPIPGDEIYQESGLESGVTSSSDAGNGSDDYQDAQPKRQKIGKRRSRAHQRGKQGPLPTLLERLTGLTGDPKDPVYRPPHSHQIRTVRRVRNRPQRNREQKERKYLEVLDSVDKFKKLSCTLIVASSMSGEDGIVDWRIVEKVYSSDKLFDTSKTKKLWTWMCAHMSSEVAEMTNDFQSLFLDAYEAEQISAIEEPDTYDWAGLIKWVMRRCPYPQPPLPVLREALAHFTVEESSYEHLDRARWYREKVADRSRTLLQIQTPFVSPLHKSQDAVPPNDDRVLKARSWTRANTATSQASYDGKQAHDKLISLGEPLLTSVVGDMVEKQNLRMRKLKRLLPGRNFSFTKAFAKKFVRAFELGDFMAAVKVKKDMDAAFKSEDPAQRFYSISRSEDDGSVTAILSLLSNGQVKLMPQLPMVNNEFGAPLPRLSVWGFCEGDYIHRAIDRERLFWDIHVVPTAEYRYGTPLQPVPTLLVPSEVSKSMDWAPLPSPPLPGKEDADALLPIWSSIDGQSVTWPWWYRILNLVLQPLVFQPGATPADIYSHCPEQTTEIFEIKLVLDWLESINAVSKTISGGYVTQPGFWAAFGDTLLQTEEDWFGEHVKRKTQKYEKQQWREEYNSRHSALQSRNMQATDSAEVEDGTNTSSQILQNPKLQYRITQQTLDVRTPRDTDNDSTNVEAPRPVPSKEQHVQDDEEDKDAEGELDEAAC